MLGRHSRARLARAAIGLAGLACALPALGQSVGYVEIGRNSQVSAAVAAASLERDDDGRTVWADIRVRPTGAEPLRNARGRTGAMLDLRVRADCQAQRMFEVDTILRGEQGETVEEIRRDRAQGVAVSLAPGGLFTLAQQWICQNAPGGAGRASATGVPGTASGTVPERPAPLRATRSSGSGFAVAADGYLLTNDHVVRACGEVQLLSARGERLDARVVARDERNDLALLKADAALQPAAFRRAPIRAGDSIVALGFPLRGLLAADVNVSVGIVSAMAGLRNDASRIQVSAPIQPGNSGGPVLDATGAVAAVAVAKLDALKVARLVGDLPQNVNFAIKAEVAQGFLRSHGVEPRMAQEPGRRLEVADSVQAARAFTYLVECDPGRQARPVAGHPGAPDEPGAGARPVNPRNEAAANPPNTVVGPAPKLVLPIGCRPGLDCIALSYFDHGGGRDYACGSRAAANQRNTRFVLAGDAMSRTDVPVLAAAAGRVAVRTNEGIALDHGGGWSTVYVFGPRELRVEPGDRVEAGDVLGYLGRMGEPAVPVLGFAVRRDGVPVDPFAPDDTIPCGQSGAGLWQPAASSALAYAPGGAITAGFAPEQPDPRKALSGAYTRPPERDAPVLGFWVATYGIRAGDREEIEVVGPDGRTIARGALSADRAFVDRLVRIHKPRPSTGWSPGRYVGTYRLARDGSVIAETSRALELH